MEKFTRPFGNVMEISWPLRRLKKVDIEVIHSRVDSYN